MKSVKWLSAVMSAVMAATVFSAVPALNADAATPEFGWYEENGNKYWYEGGVRQGTEGNGKEIYDPESDAWYWLDAIDGGKMATGKDVYQTSNGGKWVRYDKDGHMVKGWDTNENGTYYFDLTTGAMQKGAVTIDDLPCVFDDVTGIGLNLKWYQYEENGAKYWYEDGKRQGYDPKDGSYRGKEIFDPESNAWYWLDNVDQGKMATGKDVYQTSSGGKWVRYDKDGHMIKGWNTNKDGTYYFDLTTGAMQKGFFTEKQADGKEYTYYFDTVYGTMLVNKAIELDEKDYLIDEKGHLVKGVVEKNGAKYRYDAKTGEMIKGWYTEKDSAGEQYTYYYDEKTGKMTVGAKEIEKKTYLFNDDGLMVTGWHTVSNQKYYYDTSTGAMAKGIVRINGVDQSFDEKTGVYLGQYEGGEVSYNWVVVKEVMQDGNGQTIGSANYSYKNNGSLEMKTTYTESNGRKRKSEESYTYDSVGNVSSHYYQDFVNRSNTYRETFIYENGMLKKEEITDQNGSMTWIREHTYKDGKISRTDVKKGDGTPYNYITYELDNKGRVIRENYYNTHDMSTGYTIIRYYEFEGQSFLKSRLEYGADGAILCGEQYDREGYDLKTAYVFKEDRKIAEKTSYEISSFPTDSGKTSFEKTSDTYDENGNLLHHTVYTYELKDFIQ